MNTRKKLIHSRNVWYPVATTIIVFLCFCQNLFPIDRVISHTPPMRLNRNAATPLTVNIAGDYNLIDEITLSYRETGKPTYNTVVKKQQEITSNQIVFHLPAITGISAGYEYYFMVSVQGRELTYPQHNPRTNPLRVRAESERADSRDIILLSGDTNVSLGQDLVFAASFYPIENEIDVSSIRVLLNGTDVTRSAIISPPLVVFTRTKPQPGTYSFQIRGALKDGRRIQSAIWQFNAEEKRSILTDLPFNMRGSIDVTTNVRSSSQEDMPPTSRADKNDAAMRMSLFARQDWFSLVSRLYLTSLESPNKQPFNRYNLQLSVPYFDLHLLDYSPNYGSYLVSNQNIRGVSGRFSYGGLALSSTYGQSVRAIDGEVVPDTFNEGGTFQRNVFAAKLDLGQDDGMRIGFGFSKVKDDLSSLDEEYYLGFEEEIIADTTRTTRVVLTSPRDNLVLGADLRIAMDNQRLVAGAEIATSFYNSDIIDGVMSKDELEDFLEGEEIPFDPESWERFIIINKNVEPIIPGWGSTAFQLYLRWFFMNNMLNISYSEVGASFRSLGAGYVQNDASILNISDYISLFRNRLSIDAGLNIVTDNLSEQKATTTTNTSWYIQSLIRPRQDLPYFRLGTNIINTENDVDTADTPFDKLEQEMKSYNFGVGYNFFQIPQTDMSVDLSLNLSDDNDLTDNPSFEVNRTSFHLTVLNNLQPIPLQTRLSFGHTESKDKIGTNGTSTFTSFGLRNEYSFLNDMVVPHLDIATNSYGEHKSTLTRYDIGVRVLPYPQTTITTRIELAYINDKNPTDKHPTGQDYNTFGWYLNAGKRF